jgi:hypothetical protein
MHSHDTNTVRDDSHNDELRTYTDPQAADASSEAQVEAGRSTSSGSNPLQAQSLSPNWASDAPRGGRAVFNRVLKESATVPLVVAP